jgi:hypothetical protein
MMGAAGSLNNATRRLGPGMFSFFFKFLLMICTILGSSGQRRPTKASKDQRGPTQVNEDPTMATKANEDPRGPRQPVTANIAPTKTNTGQRGPTKANEG